MRTYADARRTLVKLSARASRAAKEVTYHEAHADKQRLFRNVLGVDDLNGFMSDLVLPCAVFGRRTMMSFPSRSAWRAIRNAG